MKKLLISVTMLLLMALGAQGIAAQDLEAAKGLESAYSRYFTMGVSDTVLAAGESESTPEPEGDSAPIGFEVIGFTFDSEDNANAFLESLRSDVEKTAEEAAPEAEPEIGDLELDMDGFYAVMNVDENSANAVVLFVDGNQVFLIDVSDPDREKAMDRANEVAEYVANAEIENEEVSFNEDGTSTGGVFDRIPKVGDELVGELDAFDTEIQPNGE